jgi:hypothetical protein
MNERIKELASKIWYRGHLEEQDENIQLFAELIIEECAKRAESYSYMSDNFNALAEELRGMKE